MGKIMINDINFSGGGPQIDDTTTCNSTTWSSNQTNTEITKVAHNSADEYDSTRTSSNKYNKGDLCIYQNTLYKCNADGGTYGPFDSSKWTSTTLSDEFTIEDITSSYVTTAENFTLQSSESAIYRQGNHIFGYLVIKHATTIPNSTVSWGKVNYAPVVGINTACFVADSQWHTTGIGYIYINQFGGTNIEPNNSTSTTFKLNINYMIA